MVGGWVKTGSKEEFWKSAWYWTLVWRGTSEFPKTSHIPVDSKDNDCALDASLVKHHQYNYQPSPIH